MGWASCKSITLDLEPGNCGVTSLKFSKRSAISGILQKQKESAMEWTSSTLLELQTANRDHADGLSCNARPDWNGPIQKYITWTSESYGPHRLHSGSHFHEQRSPALGAKNSSQRKDIALQGQHNLFHASALLSGPPAGRHWQHRWKKCMYVYVSYVSATCSRKEYLTK